MINEFYFDIKDTSTNGDIVIIDNKTLYNRDKGEMSLSNWCEGGARVSYNKESSFPKLSSGVKLSEAGRDGFTSLNTIGFFTNKSNSLQHSGEFVLLMSARFSDDGTKSFPVFAENFDKCCMSFAARKLIPQNWTNDKDEFLVPNTTHDNYSIFSYDSMAYALFHSSSQQSSLRKVKYRTKEYNIKNEFFFMPKQKIQGLADAHSNQKCFNDARHSEDRFVSKLISAIENGDNDVKFSDEAQLVLDLARELVVDSFDYRLAFDKVKPEYQINNWDCGWYQIKGLLNWIVESGKDKDVAAKYLEFKDAYKALGDKMRPMVYELGFLKK